MITQAELKAKLNYDPETGIFTWITHVRTYLIGRRAGTNITRNYRMIKINHKAYQEHRLAWLYVYGIFPKGVIDHINENPNDNRINNLRDTNQYSNCLNVTRKRNKYSTGITKHNNKWRVRISDHGYRHHLGLFTSLNDAIQVYQNFKNRLLGAL